MSPRDKDRWRLSGSTVGKISVGGGLLIITIGALISTLGTQTEVPGQGLQTVRLELVAARDLGSLPERSAWCTLGRAAEHCYDLQESSGTALDLGTGAWNLTATGLRRGVVTSLPTRDSTGWVDYQSERGSWGDGQAASGLVYAMAAPSATDLVSITLVIHPQEDGVLGAAVSHRDNAPPQKGWYLFLQANGSLAGTIDYGAGVISVSGSTDLRGAWHCATVVLNARAANAGRVYVNGVDETVGTGDLSVASGGFLTLSPFRIHGLFDAGTWASRHGLARVREEEGHATTLAEHQDLCGDLWQAPAGGPDDDKPAASDIAWTQTGGPRCYPSGDATAICVPGGLIPMAVDATGLDWLPEPDATNRVLYSTEVDCTNWSCRGSGDATPYQVAPDGSGTATVVSLGTVGNDIFSPSASGYTADVGLYPRLWVRCSSGTLRIINNAATGDWRIACATASAGSWVLIHSATQSGVTEASAWTASATGTVTVLMAALTGTVDAEIWGITVTEEPGSRLMVIPTAASAVSTGDPAWVIDNSTGKYWQTGDTVLQSLTQYSGTCWQIDATQIRLSGPVGSECAGAWYGVRVTP